MNTLAPSFLIGSSSFFAGIKDIHDLDEFEFWLICNRVTALDIRIEFLLNISKTNRPIKTKFCIHIIIDKIYVGIVNHCFSQICNRVRALD